MADNLSVVHFKAVRTEIEGRFFSEEEAKQLIEAIEDRTIIDPNIRIEAAKGWET